MERLSSQYCFRRFNGLAGAIKMIAIENCILNGVVNGIFDFAVCNARSKYISIRHVCLGIPPFFVLLPFFLSSCFLCLRSVPFIEIENGINMRIMPQPIN